MHIAQPSMYTLLDNLDDAGADVDDANVIDDGSGECDADAFISFLLQLVSIVLLSLVWKC